MTTALVSMLFGAAAALALVVVWLSARSGIAVALAVFGAQHALGKPKQRSGVIRREQRSPEQTWQGRIGTADPLRSAAA